MAQDANQQSWPCDQTPLEKFGHQADGWTDGRSDGWTDGRSNRTDGQTVGQTVTISGNLSSRKIGEPVKLMRITELEDSYNNLVILCNPCQNYASVAKVQGWLQIYTSHSLTINHRRMRFSFAPRICHWGLSIGTRAWCLQLKNKPEQQLLHYGHLFLFNLWLRTSKKKSENTPHWIFIREITRIL